MGPPAGQALRGPEQEVACEGWFGYYALRESERPLATMEMLMQTATESRAAALGGHEAGVGGILELLSALVLLLLAACGGEEAPPPAAVPVTVARAAVKDVPGREGCARG